MGFQQTGGLSPTTALYCAGLHSSKEYGRSLCRMAFKAKVDMAFFLQVRSGERPRIMNSIQGMEQINPRGPFKGGKMTQEEEDASSLLTPWS